MQTVYLYEVKGDEKILIASEKRKTHSCKFHQTIASVSQKEFIFPLISIYY